MSECLSGYVFQVWYGRGPTMLVVDIPDKVFFGGVPNFVTFTVPEPALRREESAPAASRVQAKSRSPQRGIENPPVGRAHLRMSQSNPSPGQPNRTDKSSEIADRVDERDASSGRRAGQHCCGKRPEGRKRRVNAEAGG